MNRFDLAYWEGAREAALALYEYLRGRSDIPEDVRVYVHGLLTETAERKNKVFREELRLSRPISPANPGRATAATRREG